MTYPESIQWLYSLRLFGAKLGLSNTRQLAALAGNPQDRLRFIHVAGTNGKGSTCAMLESVYRTAGLRVALFTSPHLVSFRERVQINRQPISEAEVVRWTGRLQGCIKHLPQGAHPTFFEALTVMALSYFAEKGCDLVVWETGMGGALDATNIVTPLASLITNVQFDHQKWLGNTLPEIAREKAGIIKPGVPALTGAEDPQALEVITAVARDLSSPFRHVPPSEGDQPPLDSIQLSLIGSHQRHNAALTLAAVHTLQPRIPVPPEAVRRGLASVEWPGRLQRVTLPSGQKVLLDGAHNPAGAAALAKALDELFPGNDRSLLLGMFQDKDWRSVGRLLAPKFDTIWLVPIQSQRTVEPRLLEAACREANPRARIEVAPSLAEVWARALRPPLVVVAGSLHLIGEALDALHREPVSSPSERHLNEWIVSPQFDAAQP